MKAISYFKSIYIYILFIVLILCFSCINTNNNLIRIGTNSWVGYQPLYLAEHTGSYHNVNVSLTQMPSASDVIRAFKNGLIDCAALTLDEAFTLMQDGEDLRLLFIMDISNGADCIMSLPEIKNAEQLRNKKIGVENSAVGAFVLSRALEINKIPASEISLVPLIFSDHEQAFLNKEVDAVVTFEPVKTKLVNAGANVIFDSKKIPNEIFDVFVARRDFCDKNKEQLDMLANAWFESLEYMQSHNKQADLFLSKQLGITTEEFKKSLDGIKLPNRKENKQILEQDFVKSATKISEIMVSKKLLSKMVDPTKLL